jgi:hypothetical protein
MAMHLQRTCFGVAQGSQISQISSLRKLMKFKTSQKRTTSDVTPLSLTQISADNCIFLSNLFRIIHESCTLHFN